MWRVVIKVIIDCKEHLRGRKFADHKEFLEKTVLPDLQRVSEAGDVHWAMKQVWKPGLVRRGVLLMFHPDDLRGMIGGFHTLFTTVYARGQEDGILPDFRVEIKIPKRWPERFDTTTDGLTITLKLGA